MWRSCFLLISCAISVLAHSDFRPNYIECQDSNECTGETCCVIGTGRFSVPACKPYQEVNEPCQSYNHLSFNTTVSYPDGVVVDFTNVYLRFCHCAAGLECNEDTSTCYDPSAEPNFNYL